MNVKDKIIQVSLELFSSKGYDKTSISDIIKATGSSRGGFYHHYKSKEEILNDVIELYMDDFKGPFNRVLQGHKGSCKDLFAVLFDTIIDFKSGQVEEWDALSKVFAFKGNHAFILKIARRFEAIVTQAYTEVIELGNEQGVFQVAYPKALAGLWARELLLLISDTQKVYWNNASHLGQELEDRISFITNFLSNELGVDQINLDVGQKLQAYLERMSQEAKNDYLVKGSK